MNTPNTESHRGAGGSVHLTHQPKGLYVLYFTEMWERLSFYGMRYLLKIFFAAPALVGGWALAEGDARLLVGLYGGLIYLGCIPSGPLADSYLGLKNAVLLGAVFQCFGHFFLSFGTKPAFVAGCWLLVAGTGLLKTNISSLVGTLYKPGDPRRDRGFSIFYQGVNLGALLAVLASVLGETGKFHWGFAAAGVGMIFSIVIFLWGSKYLPADKKHTKETTYALVATVGVVVLGLALIFGFARVTSQDTIVPILKKVSDILSIGLGVAIPVILMIIYYMVGSRIEKDRLIALAFVLFSLVIFIAIAEQALGTFTDFVEHKVQRDVVLFGRKWFEIPTTAFNAFNPLFIVLLAAPVAWCLDSIQRKYTNFSSIIKIGVGMFVLSISCVAYMLAEQAAAGHKISSLWIIVVYFLQTLAEFLTTVVALSFVTKVAPAQFKATLMGLVWGSISLGIFLSGRIGQVATPEIYGVNKVFGTLTVITLITGIVFILLSPALRRLSHGAEDISK